LTLVSASWIWSIWRHGSLYMMGAYFAATSWRGPEFPLGVILALGATLLLGIVLEFVACGILYGRDHLDHVLATSALILFSRRGAADLGPAGLALPLPPADGCRSRS